MNKILLIILILLTGPNAFGACLNAIAESEISKALAMQPNAGAKKCGGSGADKCVCFDGLGDWEVTSYKNGVLVYDDQKISAKAVRKQAEADKAEAVRVAELARMQKLKELSVKESLTSDEMKEVVKILILEKTK